MLYKMAIVVRKDLGMGCGKAAVEVSHAVQGLLMYAQVRADYRKILNGWLDEGYRKIVLRAGNEGELNELAQKSLGLGLPTYQVYDKGLTQVNPHTKTCIGIGPAEEQKIDSVVGHLKLY